jgi:undecaprenyl-diphosphatase
LQDIFRSIVLGIVQGATEFLPISSSGHLVIVPWLLNWPASSLLFDTVLHWGTLLAIFMVFWRDFVRMIDASIRSIFRWSLADPNARLGWFIVLGSIPAAVLGLLFKDFFEALFASPRAAGFFLIVTAGLLALSERLAKRIIEYTPLEEIKLRQVAVIGSAQALALAPGISRSGSTIAAGLATGLRRDVAARFSFLLGAPAFLGAGLLQLTDALHTDRSLVIAQLPELIAGFIASAVIGVIAISFLLRYLRDHTLRIFVVYCLVLGISVIILSFIRA